MTCPGCPLNVARPSHETGFTAGFRAGMQWAAYETYRPNIEHTAAVERDAADPEET